ncbi:MAG: hypothetical protein JST16_17985 [Bdellovibrionales bacterium]|nr:hypothetical protein [Bdellovibrionales bacterium]
MRSTRITSVLRAMTVIALFATALSLAGSQDVSAIGQPVSIATAVPTKTYSLDRYEDQVKEYEAEDSLSGLDRTAAEEGDITLFVGSSTFRLWRDLEVRFQDVHAINRGFGGATIDEINHYVNRLVLKYRPARIVFYAGTNDIAEGDSAEVVFREFQEFVEHVHRVLPETRIYFVSANPGPSREKWADRYNKANQLVRDYSLKTGQCKYIDITQAMRDAQGQMRKDLFVADNLHMNKQGYDIWEPVIRQALSGK